MCALHKYQQATDSAREPRPTSNPQRNPNVHKVSTDQQGNLPAGPRGIGERGRLVTALLDEKLPMQQCKTPDRPTPGEITRPQDYCRPKQRHHSHCSFCEVVDIVKCTRSSDDGADRYFMICEPHNVLTSKELWAVQYCRWEAIV